MTSAPRRSSGTITFNGRPSRSSQCSCARRGRRCPQGSAVGAEQRYERVLAEYQMHYNAARPHQGIAQRVPEDERALRATVTDIDTQQISRKPVLGGLINEYSRAA